MVVRIGFGLSIAATSATPYLIVLPVALTLLAIVYPRPSVVRGRSSAGSRSVLQGPEAG